MSGALGLIPGIAGLPWKLATAGLAAVSIGLGVYTAVVSLDRARIEVERKSLEQQIQDPKTGYVARLAQAETNVVTARAAVDQQNATLQSKSAADAAALADLSKQVAQANAATAAANTKIDRLLKTPLAGADACARMNDADKRLLETLK